MAHLIRNTPPADDIERMDLTQDSDPVPRKRTAIWEEQKPPLIPVYPLTEGDEDEDGNDSLRHNVRHELLNTALEDLTISDRGAHRRGRSIQSAVSDSGVTVVVGSDVELLYEGNYEFLRVTGMFSDHRNDCQMEGISLIRNRSVSNMLPKACNELCAVVKAGADNRSKLPSVDKYLVTRPLSAVICIRRIIFTNEPFPAHSYRNRGVGYTSQDEVEERAELVCRRKHVIFHDTMNWNVRSEAIANLQRHECDVGVPDTQLLLNWHGPLSSIKKRQDHPMAGKASTSKMPQKQNAIDLTSSRFTPSRIYDQQSSSTMTKRSTTMRKPNRGKKIESPSRFRNAASSTTNPKSHTYSDFCAGAGGTATGAQRAGFRVVLLLDYDKDACATGRENFLDADVHHKEIFTFCTEKSKGKRYIVDVSHISFPCQPYSTNHTRAGKNDEKNVATGYSVIPILDICRQRVVTFEQSPNFARQHKPSFQALVHQLTAMGYSVRWKVVNFADTGNVHSRNRLFVIASCPGQPLPAFPKPTHGNAEGLLKPTTVANVLRQLPLEIEPHMAVTVDWKVPRVVIPYDANKPLRAAITCDGGEGNLHPSGERPFNNQELAQLQGFPASHIFVGKKGSIMRQIGNAVPGKAVTPFFREIRKCLKETDEEVEEYLNEIIVID